MVCDYPVRIRMWRLASATPSVGACLAKRILLALCSPVLQPHVQLISNVTDDAFSLGEIVVAVAGRGC
jgi:hypothetical protein